MNTRIEKDSMGELHVPEDALYGAQTQRAVDNFPVSGKAMPMGFIQALIQVKKAAAQANLELATPILQNHKASFSLHASMGSSVHLPLQTHTIRSLRFTARRA